MFCSEKWTILHANVISTKRVHSIWLTTWYQNYMFTLKTRRKFSDSKMKKNFDDFKVFFFKFEITGFLIFLKSQLLAEATNSQELVESILLPKKSFLINRVNTKSLFSRATQVFWVFNKDGYVGIFFWIFLCQREIFQKKIVKLYAAVFLRI